MKCLLTMLLKILLPWNHFSLSLKYADHLEYCNFHGCVDSARFFQNKAKKKVFKVLWSVLIIFNRPLVRSLNVLLVPVWLLWLSDPSPLPPLKCNDITDIKLIGGSKLAVVNCRVWVCNAARLSVCSRRKTCSPASSLRLALIGSTVFHGRQCGRSCDRKWMER